MSLTESQSIPPRRDRSVEARHAARAAKAERERLILDSLNRGLSMAEIAARIGVTEKRMRALVREIVARRSPAPEDYVAIQIGRLNEALGFAYAAMSADNLRAVELVVRIVRALDRYHGLAPSGRRPARAGPAAETTAAEPHGAEIASQAIEKARFTPENGAGQSIASARAKLRRQAQTPVAERPETVSPASKSVRSSREDRQGREKAPGPSVIEPSPAAHAANAWAPAGPRSAPQAFGKAQFTPANGAPWEEPAPASLFLPIGPVPVGPAAFRTRFRQALLGGVAAR
jgi:DNA-binding CsgD family transcriptional regulator